MSDGWSHRILIYAAGEAINGAGALAPYIQQQLRLLEKVVTNQRVAAVAQLDSSNVPALRWILDPSGREPKYQIPDVNTGDPSFLLDFVAWSAAACPAEQTVLVLSGHGAAWEDSQLDAVLGTTRAAQVRSVGSMAVVPGAVHHPRALFGRRVSPEGSITKAVLVDGGDRDYLSNAELGAVCERIRGQLGVKIGVLVFDACLMSSWELLHELRPSTTTVVASIDELSAAGVDLVPLAQAAPSTASPQDLASQLAGSYQPKAAFDSCIAVNLDANDWSLAVASFRDLCAELMRWLAGDPARAAEARVALRVASSSVVRFVSGGLADVGALCGALAAMPSAPSDVVKLSTETAQRLQRCVLRKVTGADYQQALGLSVFSPVSTTAYLQNRPDYVRLGLPTQTGWSDVLDSVFEVVGRTRSIVDSTFGTGGADAEFVVTLRGLALDADERERIERAIRRAVLERLASVDALHEVSVGRPDVLTETRGLLPEGTAGLVIRPIDRERL